MPSGEHHLNQRNATRPTEKPPVNRAAVVAAALAAAAALCAAALAMMLACRPLMSEDLGYHLAYGQRLLDTGQIVSDASFIHPAPTPQDAGDDLPPGSWFDAAGRYRFPNANWLSQAILAVAWRTAGVNGLGALSLAIVAIVLAAQAAAVRRLSGAWAWVGPVWLATALTIYERLYLRPELFSYACLSVQFWLLCGRLTPRRLIVALAVQLLAVNMHSFWLLGAGLAAALAVESAGRAAWGRWIARSAGGRPSGRGATTLGICTLLMVAAALVSPFGWRNLALPLQTLAYMHRHHIGGLTGTEVYQRYLAGTYHPWQLIGELVLFVRAGSDGVGFLLRTDLPACSGHMRLAVLLWRRQWRWRSCWRPLRPWRCPSGGTSPWRPSLPGRLSRRPQACWLRG